MAAAAAAAAASSSCTPLLASSSRQLKSLFLLKARVRSSSLSPPLLPIYLNLRRRPAASTRSSSYNGWADLAADPFALPLQLPQSPALLPLLFLPVAALSLSRLPPLPLLAATFAAGFAARHLAPASPRSHRLAAVLADLDAQVRAFKDQLASTGADAALLLDAVDRVRDALVDAARLAGQGGNTAAASDALPPVLGDVAKEVADYFGGWTRATMRELSFSSPRKKPKDVKVAAAAVDAKSNSDVAVLDKGNKGAVAAAAAQAQQEDGDKPLDSSIQASTKHSTLGEDNLLDSAAISTGSVRVALDMLTFDKDANGSAGAGFGAQSTQEDGRLERLVFKHRYGRDSARNDPFQGGSFATESMESSLLERTLEIRDRSYRLKIERRGGEGQVNEAQEQPVDHFVCNAASFDPIDDEGAAMDSDEEFSRNVKEAAEILRKARECMMTRADEETADALLYKSARLLSTAVASRPTSLVAVGQLGNTYLLHGELKLKISRELRTLLASSGAYLNGREHVSRSRKLDQRILSRENISSALVGVCEECESLLVEAGRSYRMAMSVDSGDVKALYNWGLALIFRAQLLADIGPEAAVDADRVYLSAIDKFDAMLSKGNTYAPEALYRWGSALQQRSHLRSGNNKEKIRLLEQAKSMFEDVLYVEADNKMVREALSSCISELNYHGRWL